MYKNTVVQVDEVVTRFSKENDGSFIKRSISKMGFEATNSLKSRIDATRLNERNMHTLGTYFISEIASIEELI